MRPVIKIICFLLIPLFFFGCKPENKIEFKLPDKIDHPPRGELKSISPKEFIDLVNSGEELKLYFIEDAVPENPSHMVFIPGIITITINGVFKIIESGPVDEPLYLVSLYGATAYKIGKDIGKYGQDCVFLDGGTYRLSQEMRKNNWQFKTTR